MTILVWLVFVTTNTLAADERNTIQVGGVERSYLAYIPEHLPQGAPILFALHGTGGSGEGMRVATGHEFDRLADENGFAAIYPTGYKNSWDDCRKTDPLPAKREKIDDLGFFRALIARFHGEHGSDPSRVFVMGHSNGAQMALRVALEAPEMVAGIAAVSANLPVADNSICHPSRKPVAALLMDGTADPINPFTGGEVILPPHYSRGLVVSAPATADYWAKVAGYGGDPRVTGLPHRDPADPTSVTVSEWRAPGKKEIVFYAIAGGGHVVPNPVYTYPAVLGATTRDIDAPAEIWKFFAALKPNAGN